MKYLSKWHKTLEITRLIKLKWNLMKTSLYKLYKILVEI